MTVRFVRVCEPDVAFMPLQPPLAVQDVALVELHVRVEEPPDVTDGGDAEMVTVGMGFTLVR